MATDLAVEHERAGIEQARLAKGRDEAEYARLRYLVDEDRKRKIAEAQNNRVLFARALEDRGLTSLIRPGAAPGVVYGSDIAKVGEYQNALRSRFEGDLIEGMGQSRLDEIGARNQFMRERRLARHQDRANDRPQYPRTHDERC